ncbi:hypothetical protein FE697_020215 [Mumia zhuanghuii]|uniref:Uncharacterized protein n=2 Tax=Mumia TaxID=1546255 RepID=A0ABW1QK51_9ACTN|nr:MULTISPECIES: hypothetical protein [Mumia]KAA1418165.1 hypothetical protein FE697_020215 [Mumia zhuanghuii]
MTRVHADHTGIHVTFPGWERLVAGKSAFNAPPQTIQQATAEPGWTSQMLGARSGLAVSGYLKIGTFRHPSGLRRLVAMRRGVPLLRVAVDRRLTGFDELLISTPDAVTLAELLNAPASHDR